MGNHGVMTTTSHSDTIPAFLANTVSQRGDETALGYVRGGELRWLTWRDVHDLASRLAAGICEVGVQPGDRVAHVSENRYEWIITDLALHLAGAVHVPIHVTLSGEQIAAQISDSGSRLVIVSNDELLEKFSALIDSSVPVWGYECTSVPSCSDAKNASIVAMTQAEPEDLATILYTSGTTGRPRGVMLSQRNLATNAAASSEAFASDVNQVRLNILPLSHIYARTCDLYTWVYRGSRVVIGESRETLARDCQLVRPTVLNAVPYVYQKIADRIRAAGEDPGTERQKLRGFFGGRIETLCAGGAPLAPDVEQWFAERELPVLVGYGLTESAPVITVSSPTAHRLRAVGRALPDVEVRIADDGEILTHGPHVMMGYWQNEQATSEAIRDGWLHTGDLGQLDADGFLRISGRKKEMIVLSTGKKVHPTNVESLLTASPLIEQAAVFGEGRPCLVALIVPAEVTPADLPSSRTAIAREIERCLQSASREEQVRNFALLDRPFSIVRRELTAKLSLCRSIIAENFADELEYLYKTLPSVKHDTPADVA